MLQMFVKFNKLREPDFWISFLNIPIAIDNTSFLHLSFPVLEKVTSYCEQETFNVRFVIFHPEEVVGICLQGRIHKI